MKHMGLVLSAALSGAFVYSCPRAAIKTSATDERFDEALSAGVHRRWRSDPAEELAPMGVRPDRTHSQRA